MKFYSKKEKQCNIYLKDKIKTNFIFNIKCSKKEIYCKQKYCTYMLIKFKPEFTLFKV